MDKQIKDLSRDPFTVSLTDRALSMFVDPKTGNVLIDEGPGSGRMNGAIAFAKDMPQFFLVADEFGAVMKIRCKNFVWDVGQAQSEFDAAVWVDAVNAFLATKRTAEPNWNGVHVGDADSSAHRGAEQPA